MENDIDIVDEDTIIFADSCSKWDFSKFDYCFFEHIPNGRYHRDNGETRVSDLDILMKEGGGVF